MLRSFRRQVNRIIVPGSSLDASTPSPYPLPQRGEGRVRYPTLSPGGGEGDHGKLPGWRMLALLCYHWRPLFPVTGRLLEGMRELQHAEVILMPSNDLNSHR